MKKLRMLTMAMVVLMAMAVVVPSTFGRQGPTIAEIVVASSEAEEPQFTLLRAALETAGLVDVFNGNRQFTVFAPTDAAFLALGEETLNAVLADTELLTNILTYHVTTGNRGSQSVVNARQIRMFNGDFAFPSIQGGNAFINDSQIIITDIQASNGTIHVIDAVLLPPAGE